VEFPVKYLGMPRALAKLSKAALQPLLDRVADHLLVWKGCLMRQSGRLILIRTTLSAIPVHTSISLGLPPWLHKACLRIMITFLWTGMDMVRQVKCLLAWKRVQRPLKLGGLGVLDLNLLGIALRFRWLWLQYMAPDQPWASMRVVEDAHTSAFFYASVRFNLIGGATFMFWVDPWLDGRWIFVVARDLYDVIPVRRRRRLTVATTLESMRWVRDITGALTIIVLMQYVHLYQRLQATHLSPDMCDWLAWRLSANGVYNSCSAYAALHLGQASVTGANKLWKTKALNNCHFFIWLVLLGRCWTN
jgi:hypothetical protein